MLRWLLLLLIIALALLSLWVATLSTEVRDKFSGKRWEVPSRIYARPLQLFDGADFGRTDLERELKAIGYRQSKGAGPGSWYRDGRRLFLHTRGFTLPDRNEPAQQVSLDWDARGHLILRGSRSALLLIEPMHIGVLYPGHGEDRLLVSSQQIPELLLSMLIAVEDRHYFEHPGVHFPSVIRALGVNLQSGRIRQGASTLTQQLVKNFYLTSERTLQRKLTEMLMALLLDYYYTKEDILHTYVNEVFLAQEGKRAIHGFALASQHFFGRNLDELQLHQLALLVGMIKAPSTYNPRRNPDTAHKRRNLVLDICAQAELITPAQAQVYKNMDLALGAATTTLHNFPAWNSLVYRQLRENYSEEDLRSSGLRIYTSLDPQVQWRAERTLSQGLTSLEAGFPRADNLQGAIVVVAPENAEILALVSDRNPRYPGFNRALDSYRHIGSLIKPVIYLMALKQGRAPNFPLLNEPIELDDGQGGVWAPQNFSRKYGGKVLMYQALIRSLNLPILRLTLSIGHEQLADELVQLGIPKRQIPRVPALALGAVSLSPLQVAQLYQVFAAGGFQAPLRSIRSVVNAQGKVLERHPFDITQTIDPEVMHLLQWGLLQVMNEGTGSLLGLARNSAMGKTGTTNNYRDSWFVGANAEHLSVVWLGRDDNDNTSLTGASGAMQIWHSLSKKLGAGKPPLSVHSDAIVRAWINPSDGLRTPKSCKNAVQVPFIRGSEPGRMSRNLRRCRQ